MGEKRMIDQNSLVAFVLSLSLVMTLGMLVYKWKKLDNLFKLFMAVNSFVFIYGLIDLLEVSLFGADILPTLHHGLGAVPSALVMIILVWKIERYSKPEYVKSRQQYERRNHN